MYTDEFMPNFDQYWQAFKILVEDCEIISVTEPLVNTFLGVNGLKGTPCGGRSMRVTPDRRRKLRNHYNEPDEFCPIFKGKHIKLDGQLSSAAKPIRTGSICTTIVRGK
jgi:hypothetical protein